MMIGERLGNWRQLKFAFEEPAPNSATPTWPRRGRAPFSPRAPTQPRPLRARQAPFQEHGNAEEQGGACADRKAAIFGRGNAVIFDRLRRGELGLAS